MTSLQCFNYKYQMYFIRYLVWTLYSPTVLFYIYFILLTTRLIRNMLEISSFCPTSSNANMILIWQQKWWKSMTDWWKSMNKYFHFPLQKLPISVFFSWIFKMEITDFHTFTCTFKWQWNKMVKGPHSNHRLVW